MQHKIVKIWVFPIDDKHKKMQKWRDNIPSIIGVINSETILAKGLSILVLIRLMHEDHQMNG